MLTLNQLTTLQTKSNSAVTRMDDLIAGLNAAIEKFTAETGRTPAYILENVQAARAKVLPALAAELATVRDVMTQTDPHQRFWESKSLLMSLQKFDPDNAKDAEIKLNLRAELADTPVALLQLAWENARIDGNLALIWAIFHTGQKLSAGNAGFAAAIDMSIDGLTIPDQAAALAAIAVCHTNLGRAETVAAVATGLRINPLKKMDIGREQAVTTRLATAALAS